MATRGLGALPGSAHTLGTGRQLDGAELELEELARKKEELANMQALGVAATQEVRRAAQGPPRASRD